MPQDDPLSGNRPRSGRRRWLYRFLSATLVPLLVLGTLELGLRAVGYGHPARFLVAIAGQSGYATNPAFGRRFFPRELARAPVPQRLKAPKHPDAYRVFILGGSAALGTPDSSFGVGAILEQMLRELYPTIRFEIVNAAMTAVNSHVVREMARDCARHRPDLFPVYLGNNEVVGPYGPGTVFRRFTPSLGLIRLSIRASSKSTLTSRPIWRLWSGWPAKPGPRSCSRSLPST